MVGVVALRTVALACLAVVDRVKGAGHAISTVNEVVLGTNLASAILDSEPRVAHALPSFRRVDRVLSADIEASSSFSTPQSSLGTLCTISSIVS